jgi:Domain of unknown function (DUF1704)
MNTIDDPWYGRLSELAAQTPETFSLLEPPREYAAKLRQKFERSSPAHNPDLTAKHVDTAALSSLRGEWHKLHNNISSRETNLIVAAAYQERINEVIANLDLVIASAAGDMAAFDAHNEAIYGQPDRAVFDAACRWLTERIGGGPVGFGGGDAAMLLPSQAVFDRVKRSHLGPGGYFDRLFGGLMPATEVVTSDIGDPICRQMLADLGSDFTLEDSENGLWSVQASRQAVLRPPGYAMDRRTFMAITGHEIGSHLAEFVNGGNSPLRLLQFGFDRYEAGNEGRAWLREQILYSGPAEYAGLTSISLDPAANFTVLPSFEYRACLHVAIGLGLGYAGHRYAFREIYDCIFEIYRQLIRLHQGVAPEQLAHDAAWNIAVRVCKGTDGQGGAYRKDIVYLEGNLRCWEIAKTHPEQIMQGDMGKYDIANPKHIAILKSLNILRETANRDVPFITNTPENLHCLQASYGMIRQYFEPAWQINWEEWSHDTGYVEHKGSWSLAGLLWFNDHGYDVRHLSSFDYSEFARDGADYLLRTLGKTAGEWEIKYTDIPLEQSRSRQLLETDIWQKIVPTFEHITALLDDGYLIKCIVNQRTLNGHSGFLGHAVVVKGYTNTHLILHDPGLPARPERYVRYDDFANAWSSPTMTAEKLDAIRKRP